MKFDFDVKKNSNYIEEERYLTEVLAYLDKRINYLQENTNRREQESIEIKRQAYESGLEQKELNSNGIFDSAMVQNELDDNAQVMLRQNFELNILHKVYNRPYFGRVDFKFKDENNTDTIYIGIKDILDLDNYKQYVIDWRAPIASLYYDYKNLGPASYVINNNEVKGEILAKYQMLIENAKLVNVLDISEQINDEVLQVILSKWGSARMKNIVETIQAEQNEIIRAEIKRTLVIQGVAGSGKTSIAMHRAAYLLYLLPELKASDMLLVSPSKSFAAYLAEVLPSLSEKNINYLTITDILREELTSIYGRYDSYDFKQASEEKIVQFASIPIIDLIREFSQFLTDSIFEAKELAIEDDIYIPQNKINHLYKVNYTHLPAFQRKHAIIEYIQDYIGDKRLYSQYQKEILQMIDSMYSLNLLVDIYKLFWHWLKIEKNIVFNYDAENLDNLDLGLLVLIKIYMYGKSDTDWVKHIIVDEMQDLFPHEHEILKLLFQCPRTILGDINQAVKFKLPPDYLQDIINIYTNYKLKVEYYNLNKSYRSTNEISAVAKSIMPMDFVQAIDRPGEDVEIKEYSKNKSSEIYLDLYNTLINWRDEGLNTAAVIVKNLKELEDVKCNILRLMENDLINQDLILNSYLKDENDFAITICDIENSKGIEFDAVIIFNASKDNYSSELDRTKLFVACTRALHILKIYSIGDKTKFLESK